MKKSYFIIVNILLLIGCYNKNNDEYLSNYKISKTHYYTDSVLIKNDLDSLLKIAESVFYSFTSENVERSKSIVTFDSLLFSKNQNRVTILICVEYVKLHYYDTTNDKPVDIGKQKLFDGFVLLGKKYNNRWKYYEYPIEIGNYKNKKDCLHRLNEIFYKELQTYKNFDKNNYNINDKRFWEEPIWKDF